MTSWYLAVLAFLVGCRHRHTTTWPHRERDGRDYVTCLDCGRQILSELQLGVGVRG